MELKESDKNSNNFAHWCTSKNCPPVQTFCNRRYLNLKKKRSLRRMFSKLSYRMKNYVYGKLDNSLHNMPQKNHNTDYPGYFVHYPHYYYPRVIQKPTNEEMELNKLCSDFRRQVHNLQLLKNNLNSSITTSDDKLELLLGELKKSVDASKTSLNNFVQGVNSIWVSYKSKKKARRRLKKYLQKKVMKQPNTNNSEFKKNYKTSSKVEKPHISGMYITLNKNKKTKQNRTIFTIEDTASNIPKEKGEPQYLKEYLKNSKDCNFINDSNLFKYKEDSIKNYCSKIAGNPPNNLNINQSNTELTTGCTIQSESLSCHPDNSIYYGQNSVENSHKSILSTPPEKDEKIDENIADIQSLLMNLKCKLEKTTDARVNINRQDSKILDRLKYCQQRQTNQKLTTDDMNIDKCLKKDQKQENNQQCRHISGNKVRDMNQFESKQCSYVLPSKNMPETSKKIQNEKLPSIQIKTTRGKLKGSCDTTSSTSTNYGEKSYYSHVLDEQNRSNSELNNFEANSYKSHVLGQINSDQNNSDLTWHSERYRTRSGQSRNDSDTSTQYPRNISFDVWASLAMNEEKFMTHESFVSLENSEISSSQDSFHEKSSSLDSLISIYDLPEKGSLSSLSVKRSTNDIMVPLMDPSQNIDSTKPKKTSNIITSKSKLYLPPVIPRTSGFLTQPVDDFKVEPDAENEDRKGSGTRKCTDKQKSKLYLAAVSSQASGVLDPPAILKTAGNDNCKEESTSISTHKQKSKFYLTAVSCWRSGYLSPPPDDLQVKTLKDANDEKFIPLPPIPKLDSTKNRHRDENKFNKKFILPPIMKHQPKGVNSTGKTTIRRKIQNFKDRHKTSAITEQPIDPSEPMLPVKYKEEVAETSSSDISNLQSTSILPHKKCSVGQKLAKMRAECRKRTIQLKELINSDNDSSDIHQSQEVLSSTVSESVKSEPIRNIFISKSESAYKPAQKFNQDSDRSNTTDIKPETNSSHKEIKPEDTQLNSDIFATSSTDYLDKVRSMKRSRTEKQNMDPTLQEQNNDADHLTIDAGPLWLHFKVERKQFQPNSVESGEFKILIDDTLTKEECKALPSLSNFEKPEMIDNRITRASQWDAPESQIEKSTQTQEEDAQLSYLPRVSDKQNVCHTSTKGVELMTENVFNSSTSGFVDKSDESDSETINKYDNLAIQHKYHTNLAGFEKDHIKKLNFQTETSCNVANVQETFQTYFLSEVAKEVIENDFEKQMFQWTQTELIETIDKSCATLSDSLVQIIDQLKVEAEIQTQPLEFDNICHNCKNIASCKSHAEPNLNTSPKSSEFQCNLRTDDEQRISKDVSIDESSITQPDADLSESMHFEILKNNKKQTYKNSPSPVIEEHDLRSIDLPVLGTNQDISETQYASGNSGVSDSEFSNTGIQNDNLEDDTISNNIFREKFLGEKPGDLKPETADYSETSFNNSPPSSIPPLKNKSVPNLKKSEEYRLRRDYRSSSLLSMNCNGNSTSGYKELDEDINRQQLETQANSASDSEELSSDSDQYSDTSSDTKIIPEEESERTMSASEYIASHTVNQSEDEGDPDRSEFSTELEQTMRDDEEVKHHKNSEQNENRKETKIHIQNENAHICSRVSKPNNLFKEQSVIRSDQLEELNSEIEGSIDRILPKSDPDSDYTSFVEETPEDRSTIQIADKTSSNLKSDSGISSFGNEILKSESNNCLSSLPSVIEENENSTEKSKIGEVLENFLVETVSNGSTHETIYSEEKEIETKTNKENEIIAQTIVNEKNEVLTKEEKKQIITNTSSPNDELLVDNLTSIPSESEQKRPMTSKDFEQFELSETELPRGKNEKEETLNLQKRATPGLQLTSKSTTFDAHEFIIKRNEVETQSNQHSIDFERDPPVEVFTFLAKPRPKEGVSTAMNDFKPESMSNARADGLTPKQLLHRSVSVQTHMDKIAFEPLPDNFTTENEDAKVPSASNSTESLPSFNTFVAILKNRRTASDTASTASSSDDKNVEKPQSDSTDETCSNVAQSGSSSSSNTFSSNCPQMPPSKKISSKLSQQNDEDENKIKIETRLEEGKFADDLSYCNQDIALMVDYARSRLSRRRDCEKVEDIQRTISILVNYVKAIIEFNVDNNNDENDHDSPVQKSQDSILSQDLKETNSDQPGLVQILVELAPKIDKLLEISQMNENLELSGYDS